MTLTQPCRRRAVIRRLRSVVLGWGDLGLSIVSDSVGYYLVMSPVQYGSVQSAHARKMPKEEPPPAAALSEHQRQINNAIIFCENRNWPILAAVSIFLKCLRRSSRRNDSNYFPLLQLHRQVFAALLGEWVS